MISENIFTALQQSLRCSAHSTLGQNMAFRVLLLFSAFVCVTRCGVPETTVSPEITANATTTEAPLLCDVCSCTDGFVNCTYRGLEDTFEDISQWPKIPLNEVSFEGNSLVHIKPFPAVVIRKLILRKNRIVKIDNCAFKELRNLTELDLSHNQLTVVQLKPDVFEGRYSPEAYEPLAKLEFLNLASNDLHTLDQDLFEHLAGLKVLNLAGNPFTIISTQTSMAINSLPYLEELDLSYCELQSLPNDIFHVPRYLTRLNLNGNRFTELPDALEHAKALQYLSLDENPIEKIMNNTRFPVMPKLMELSLCCMPHLSEIGPGVFSQLTALESLRVQNCPKLRKIHEMALETSRDRAWPPLKKLDISDNALQYLPSTLVGRWDKLEELDLMNNEWSCDCDNQYLINILLPQLGKKLMGEEVNELKCASPAQHFGKKIVSLSGRHVRCLDAYDAQPEKDAAVLVGMLIGLLVAIPIGLALFTLWRRGFLFCGQQTPASFSRAFYKRTASGDEFP